MIKNFFCLTLIIASLFIFSCGPTIDVRIPIKVEKLHIDFEEETVHLKYHIKKTIFIDSVDNLEEKQMIILERAKTDLINADFSVVIISVPGGSTDITYFCGPVKIGFSNLAISRALALKLFSPSKDDPSKPIMSNELSTPKKPL
jgi:hypothetical protein